MKREDRRWVPAPAGLAVAPACPRLAPARTRSRLDDRLARSTRGPKGTKGGTHSRNERLWNASLGLLRLDPGELHDLAPLFRFIRDHFSEISRRHRCRHDAKLAETRFHLGIG